MSGKIHVLLGKTLSGKTTISNILEKDHGIRRVVSFTTRPKRENEIDGVDYHFYEDIQVYSLIAGNNALALRSYQPHHSFGPYPWYYGINKKDIDLSTDVLIITDFEGLKQIEEEFGKDKVVSHYLDITYKEQIKRLETRGKELTEEQYRRIESDDKDFNGTKEYVDYVHAVSKQPKTIAKAIAKTMKEAINWVN